MRGSIVKRGTRYHAVVDLPPGPDGRRRQKWLSGYGSKREAEAALSAATGDLHAGRYLEPSAMTLGQYLSEEWLPASAARVRPSTLDSYRGLLRRNAIPALGHLPLSEVSPVALTKLYGQLLAGARHDGHGGPSTRSVRYLHTVLHKAFADAVCWRYLAVNPCDAAQPPSASAARAPEMRTWSVEELQEFLVFTAGDEHHIGYLLAAACGLRRGELLGLRWRDVELDPARGGPQLRIRQQLVEVAYTLRFCEPKTAAGRRSVAANANRPLVERKSPRSQQASMKQDLTDVTLRGPPSHGARAKLAAIGRAGRRAGWRRAAVTARLPRPQGRCAPLRGRLRRALTPGAPAAPADGTAGGLTPARCPRGPAPSDVLEGRDAVRSGARPRHKQAPRLTDV